MGKIIIHNNSRISDKDALIDVAEIVSLGKISETAKGKQYCFAMSNPDKKVSIYSGKNKDSDWFTIVNDEVEGGE